MRVFSALSLLLSAASAAAELTAREKLAALVNSKKTTWHASAGGKFSASAPLGAHRNLYGVKAGSLEAFEALAAMPGNGYEKAERVSAAVAADIPDAFDSEANWPECAKVIGDIRGETPPFPAYLGPPIFRGNHASLRMAVLAHSQRNATNAPFID